LLGDGITDSIDQGKEEGEVDAAGDGSPVGKVEFGELGEQSTEVQWGEWKGVDQRGLDSHDSSGPRSCQGMKVRYVRKNIITE